MKLAVCGLPHSSADEFLHQGLADVAAHAAVDLTVDDGGVDDDAGVVARRVPHEPDLAGVAVDVDNGEMHAERERCRRRLEVVLCGEWLVRVSGLRCDLCPADSHTRRTRDGKRPARYREMSAGLASRTSAATAFACSTTVLVAFQIVVPPTCSEREPPVPPRLTSSVSPWRTSTLSTGMPVSSLASWAKVV